MFFHFFPYTNVHELNLDWIIEELKKVRNDLEAFKKDTEENFKDVRKTITAEVKKLQDQINSLVQSVEDLRTYVDTQNSALNQKITDLKTYVDTQDSNLDQKIAALDARFTEFHSQFETFATRINMWIEGTNSWKSQTETNITDIYSRLETMDSSLAHIGPELAKAKNYIKENVTYEKFIDQTLRTKAYCIYTESDNAPFVPYFNPYNYYVDQKPVAIEPEFDIKDNNKTLAELMFKTGSAQLFFQKGTNLNINQDFNGYIVVETDQNPAMFTPKNIANELTFKFKYPGETRTYYAYVDWNANTEKYRFYNAPTKTVASTNGTIFAKCEEYSFDVSPHYSAYYFIFPSEWWNAAGAYDRLDGRNYKIFNESIRGIIEKIKRVNPYAYIVFTYPLFFDANDYSTNYSKFYELVHDERLLEVYKYFIDIHSYILTEGLSRAGITPTEQDLADIGNHIVPTSLRDSTGTKLSITANQILSQIILEQMYSRTIGQGNVSAPADPWGILS